MRNKRLYLILIFVLLILFTQAYLAKHVIGITKDATIATIADMDTYVDSDSPTSNYGSETSLWVDDSCEAYFHFNISDKPESITKVEFIFAVISNVFSAKNITLYLIEDSWDEDSTVWTTKPTKGEKLMSTIINQGGYVKFNITSYIGSKTEISFCVTVDSLVLIQSKEVDYEPYNSPQLNWTYTGNFEINVISPQSPDEWEANEDYTIRWTTTGTIERVIVQIYKGSLLIDNLTLYYALNNGEISWGIPYAMEEGNDYRIKITDYEDPNVYGFSEYFSIVSPSTSSSPSIGGYDTIFIIAILAAFGIFLIFIKKKNLNS